MSNLFKNVSWYIMWGIHTAFLCMLKYFLGVYDEEVACRLKLVTDQFRRTQKTCEMIVEKEPWLLGCIPDHFMTQEMYDKAVRTWPSSLEHIPNHLKIQGMCEMTNEVPPYMLRLILDHLKIQKMCEKAVEVDPWLLICFPDWFVRQQKIGP